MAKYRRRAIRLESFDEMEPRLLMAAPVVDPIADVSVPLTKTRIVPITASDADGDTLNYTVQSNNAAFTGRVLTGTVDLKMTVQGFGDMVFKLIPEFAPKTVETIVGLVNNGFYNGLTFHRVISNFMIQGGDPLGTGSGGPGFKFDDEFNPEAIFSGYGQLAMANSGKDTNGSQFFVTTSSPRWLDFEHTIFGQLVRGVDVLNAIKAVPTGTNDKPTNNVVITNMSVTTNRTDALLLIDSVSAGTATITVTANDGTGNMTSKSFAASSVSDTANNAPPILGPVTNVVTAVGVPIDIPLTAIDLENNPLVFDAAVTDSTPQATKSVNGNVIKITPNAGYVGDVNVITGVRQSVSPSRWDTQNIKVQVKQQSIQAQSSAASAVEGTSVTRTLGTFTPVVPLTASAYTATVAWGANPAVPASVVAGPNGTYNIVATVNQNRFGSYGYSLQVTDTLTNTTASTTGSLTVTDADIPVSFIAPSVNGSTRSVSGTVGSIADANGSGLASDVSATIDWGDNTSSPGTIVDNGSGRFEVLGNKTYASLGSYSVKVNVTSLGGKTSSATGTVVIGNQSPVITPIGSKTVAEGSTLAFKVQATDPDAGQQLVYSFGPGAPAGATIDPATGDFSWKPGSPQSVTITVNASDNGSPSLSASRSFAVEVTSVAPTIQMGPAGSIRQTETYTGSGAITDPGQGPWTATVDYGDGSGPRALTINADRTFALSRQYDTVGNFTVKVVVTDSAAPNAPVSQTLLVNVSNVAPTVQAGGAATLTQFDTFERSGSFSDLGAGSWTATVDYGDGSGKQNLVLNGDRTFRLSRRYTTAGNFAVKVVVTDQFGISGEATVPVTVAARPLVSIVSSSSVIRRNVVSSITLVLSGDVSAASATNPNAYTLALVGRDRKFGTKDDVIIRFKSATLSGRTITLTPLKRLTLTGKEQFRVANLVDTFNRPLVRANAGTVSASMTKAGVLVF